MMSAKEQLSFRVSPETKAQLLRLSAISNRSMTNLFQVLADNFERTIVSRMNEGERDRYFLGELRFAEYQDIRLRDEEMAGQITAAAKRADVALSGGI
jgi:hypothetical protein